MRLSSSSSGNGTKEPLLGAVEATSPSESQQQQSTQNFRQLSVQGHERVLEPFVDYSHVEDKKCRYPPNVVVTSRYTLFSFLPKSIFEQFRRLANVYFLVLGIIAAVGANTMEYDTAVEPEGLLVPMTIVVMISIIKDGIEDYKRHQADDRTNNRKTRLVNKNGSVSTVLWRDLQVGNIILLVGNDEVPADVVVLDCGGIQGPTTYIETAAIDGETNLKIRLPCLPRQDQTNTPGGLFEGKLMDEMYPVHETGYSKQMSHVRVSVDKTSVLGLDKFAFKLHAENPNGSIHRFNGSLEVMDLVYRRSSDIPLSERNVCLRGSIIRASEWSIGMVVYTGKDTKLSMNSKSVPSKLSVVDSVVNRTLIIAISSMVVVCVISAILNVAWQVSNENADYLCLKEDDLDDRFTGGGGCESGTSSSGLSVLTFATLYNNFVCISMYVSLEIVYLWQGYFIANDLKIYDEETDTPAEAHTSGMSADLGQVQYVFSDKTGTLTKNVMKLRRCSVAGMIYGSPLSSGTHSLNIHQMAENTSDAVSVDSILTDANTPWVPLSALANFKRRNTPRNSDHKILVDFLCTLAVCNNVMLMPDTTTGKLNVTDKKSLEACLEAESADEVALVLAAAEHAKVILSKRDSKSATITGTDYMYNTLTNLSGLDTTSVQSAASVQSAISRDTRDSLIAASNNSQDYQILAVNEFDSHRKRMSIVVRVENGPVLLLCKGADTSMFPRCQSSPYLAQCRQHVEEFANSGLRTLILAKRVLPDTVFNSWLEKYQQASNSLGNRGELLLQCADELETELELLGAVGIEDELQDGVAEAIGTIQKAGINVWMITGDKPETAMAIGHMCGLLRHDQNIELLVRLSGEELRRRVSDLVSYLVNLETDYEDKSKSITDLETSSVNSMSATFLNLFNGKSPVHEMNILSTDSTSASTNTTTLYVPSDPPTASVTQQRFSESLVSRKSNIAPVNKTETQTSHKTVASQRSTRKKSIDLSKVGLSKTSESAFKNVALVVDGLVFEEIHADQRLSEQFTMIARCIPTVLACRVSPLQKASLVRIVKHGEAKPVTLAIGDGANDVGMIHEAKVGVGIAGREGRHAANSSDFAIGQFRYLARLLVHHGRYNYIRSSKLVLYSFFKNLVLVSSLFYYCVYSGFSGTVPLDSIVFSGFNFYLGLPIIAVGMMDRDVSEEAINKYIHLAYSTGRDREMLNLYSMGRWVLLAFVEGLVLYALAIRFVGGRTSPQQEDGTNIQGIGLNNSDGEAGGIYSEGLLLFCSIIVAMQYKVACITCVWTWIHVAAWMLSFVGFILFVLVYSQFIQIPEWYKVTEFVFSNATFWLAMLLIPIAISTLDYFVEKLSSFINPSSQDKLLSIVANEEHNRENALFAENVHFIRESIDKEFEKQKSVYFS